MEWHVDVIDYIEALDWDSTEEVLNAALRVWIEKRENAPAQSED